MSFHRTDSRNVIVCLMGLAGTLCGCGPTETPEENGAKSPNKNNFEKTDAPRKKKRTKELPAFTPPKEVTLKDVTPKELTAFIAKHKGQAVLVDYWATWCTPCKKAFPHTLELSRKYAKEGLVVVSVCLDTFEQRKQAMTFLKDQKAYIVNFYASEKLDPDRIFPLFDVEAIPHYRVYGPDGKLVRAISPPEKVEGQTAADLRKTFMAQIDAAVERALGYEYETE